MFFKIVNSFFPLATQFREISAGRTPQRGLAPVGRRGSVRN